MVYIGIYLPVYGGWFRTTGLADPSLINEREHPPTYSYVKSVALKAEEIGVYSLWIPDHMLNPIKGEDKPSLEAWTLAAALAEATSRIYLSHTTLCEAFRYPAVLAKQAATLWEISGGRFWLSLGAGWFKREYEAFGLLYLEHDERVRRAYEAIEIIKGLFSEDRFSYSGKYYSVLDGHIEPRPNPPPPIWYAGMSEASRRLVAKLVDGWLMRGCTLEDAERFINDMYRRLDEEGRGDIEIAIPGLTIIRDSDEEAFKVLDGIAGGVRPLLDRTLDTGLVGSVETVADKIDRLEELGVDHVLLQLTPSLEELDWVRELIRVL